MKCLTLIGLIALVTIASAKLPSTPKNSIRVTPISIFQYQDNKPKACVEKCTSDCTTLIKCIGDKEIKVNCRQQSGGQKPFCNEDLKQCDASSEYCPSENIETCDLNDGFYPNILNCKSFYYCIKASKKRINYNCMGTSVYNVLAEQCEVGVQCINFDTSAGLCKGKLDQLLVHPVKKSLYIYCQDPPELLQCPNDNYEFDPTILNCNYVCKKPGRFNDPVKNIGTENENVYYIECVKNGAAFIKYNKKCASGTHFQPDDENGKGKCVLNQ